MLWHIYLHKGTVFVPTVAKTEAGFFFDVEPVAVIERFDHVRIADAIKWVVIKGNPVIETPTRLTFPKPAVLNYANVKSWAAFEKKALCWIVTKKEDVLQVCPQRKKPTGGWDDDTERKETFTGTTAIDEIANIVAGEISATQSGLPG